MANEMVERVARAMASNDSGPEGSKLFDIHWQEFGLGYIDSAKVAIEAMREPTKAMRDAGDKAGGQAMEWSGTALVHHAMYSWPAMIDAALSD